MSHPSGSARQRWGGRLALLGLVLVAAVGVGVVMPSGVTPAESADGTSYRITAKREHVDAEGTATTVDTRNVTMRVSQTTDLRGRQQVDVAWTGAHPTGGSVADINSGDAANEEYPFVLLQCRGTVAGASQVRPETCWTQTSSERFQKDNTFAWPAWRSDARATPDQRLASVGAPDPRPAPCFSAARAERWVPFEAIDKKTYAGGSAGCAGMAPEAANVGGAGMPSNTTYGITGKDGRGSAQFTVWTEDENASLGCSSAVPCSLVAVPVMGVSCDAYGTGLSEEARPTASQATRADTACRAADVYQPGDIATAGRTPNPAVTGALWWSPSNWSNRITVPLTFAVSSNVCSVLNPTAPLSVFGSVLFGEVSAQWAPRFCTDKQLKPIVHVQTADTAARTLITVGNASVAITSRAPDDDFGGRPVVQAPLTVTGFAVSYAIDDAKGEPYAKLKLNARLLAKLLTQSYPANSLVREYYPALRANPMNITADPEFIALNPGLRSYDSVEAAATIMTLSTEADLVWALTSYLQSDPEARRWLDGVPDPWGTVVNPNYQRIELPVESWPMLDDFTLPDAYIRSNNNACYSYSPSPYLGLIANPTAFVQTIVQNLQYAISNVNLGCPNGDPADVTTLRLTVQGRQQPGYRFVLGVTPLTAAHRYSLRTAALQTTSQAAPNDQITDAAGRTFVAPDDAGLRAAGALLEPDEEAGTWSLNYDKLHETDGAEAYPGTMPVYADVPTIGLTRPVATRAAQLLEFAVTDGQRRGTANGELPIGALPLTEANGLSALAAYTHRAAVAVLAQNGEVPSLAPPDVTTPTADAPTADGPTADGPAAPPAGTVDLPDVDAPGVAPVDPAAAAAARPGGKKPTKDVASADVVRTVGQSSTFGRFGLPLVLFLGLVLGLTGFILRFSDDAVAATRGALAQQRARRTSGGGG